MTKRYPPLYIPHVVWRMRANNAWEVRWQCRSDIAKRGYDLKSLRLWNGREDDLTEIVVKQIADKAKTLQMEMLVWSRYHSALSLLRRAGVDYQAQDHPVMLQEPLRDQIGRVIYECDEEQGNSDRPDWYCLSEERREPWRKDADRVILLLKDLCLLRGIS